MRDVAARGDAALVERRRLDWPDATQSASVREEIDTAYDMPDDQRRALVKACERVRRFRAVPSSLVDRAGGGADPK